MAGVWVRGRLLVAFIFACLAACSNSSGPSSQPATVATPVDPATAGRIRVQVRYDGPLVKPKEIIMRSAPQCAAAHSTPVFDESLLVEDGGLANVVVWIKGGLEGWTFLSPSEPVVIDQAGCLYSPRVVTAMVHQPVEFRNSDPEAHNVHGRPAVVRGWNFMMSRQGSTRTLTFDKPEIAVPIGCDIHPWMVGFVAVVPNPYAAVTSRDGRATLENVPPGEYLLGLWHEKLGTKEQRVTVAPQASVDLTITYSAAP